MYGHRPDCNLEDKVETLESYEPSNCILCGNSSIKFRYRGKMICENCMGIIRSVY